MIVDITRQVKNLAGSDNGTIKENVILSFASLKRSISCGTIRGYFSLVKSINEASDTIELDDVMLAMVVEVAGLSQGVVFAGLLNEAIQAAIQE